MQRQSIIDRGALRSIEYFQQFVEGVAIVSVGAPEKQILLEIAAAHADDREALQGFVRPGFAEEVNDVYRSAGTGGGWALGDLPHARKRRVPLPVLQVEIGFVGH